MFKKINTRTLLIILFVFGGLVAFNKLYQSKKEESTFRSVFVSIDTSAVTSIFIYPQAEKGKEIKITKNGSHWDLQNDKIKTVADTQAVHGLLAPFAEMKSLSLSGQDKSSWKDLQVDDSSGTKISFVTSENKRYDLVVGRFGYNQQTRNGITNLRHADEEAVYAVGGFLSFSINQPFNSWRNKTFIKGNKDNWTSVTFNYPDSSFQLSKTNNVWMVNGEIADSTKAVQYLNGLASMQSSGFVDGYAPSSTPVFTISINGNNQPAPITVQAYPADSTQKFILHSSLNPEAYFGEDKSHLSERIFVGKGNFMK